MTLPATAKVTPIRPTATEAAGAQRRHNEGHGRRLTAAFEALEAFPALAESRDRLLRLVTAERIPPGDVVAAVEGWSCVKRRRIRLRDSARAGNASSASNAAVRRRP